jgi:hypothetical protein
MKYAAEMGSGAMKYIPRFINNGSAIEKLIGGGGLQTTWRLHTPVFIFSQ